METWWCLPGVFPSRVCRHSGGSQVLVLSLSFCHQTASHGLYPPDPEGPVSHNCSQLRAQATIMLQGELCRKSLQCTASESGDSYQVMQLIV